MSERLFLSPPHMSGEEQRLVAEAFAANYVAPAGAMLDTFEREFAAASGIPHCVALSSGTAAMHLAVKLLGVEPGDEVWAATLTFIGSIGPAVHERAVPVFFDCDEATWTLDPVLLEEALHKAARVGRLPKAVIPTDLYGQSCDLDRIVELCAAYGVPVIADSAEAVGARYKNRHAGDGARIAVFSFNGNKIVTASTGGLFATHDKALAARARHLATQARAPVVHYEHEEVGFNYRLSNICAAIGLGQMRALAARVARRRAINARYRENLSALPSISFMPEAPYGTPTHWLTTIVIDPKKAGATAEKIRAALDRANIESRPVWKPMHLQPVFASTRTVGGGVAEHLFGSGLCLPSGSSMRDSDVDRVSDIVRKMIR